MARRKHIRHVVEGSGLASLILEYPQGSEPATIAQWLNESYGTEFTRAHIEGFLLRARKPGYKEAILRSEIAETEHVLSNSIDTLDDIIEDAKSVGPNFRKDTCQIQINAILAMGKLIKDRRLYLKERLKLYELQQSKGDVDIDLTPYPPEIDINGETPPPLNPEML
jgi:hypothetical protein